MSNDRPGGIELPMNTITNPTASTAALAGRGVAFARDISGAAARHGLDPRLLAAVAAQETGGPGSNAGHNVVGDGGHGHGLFQIDDRFHSFAATPAAMDPTANADYAARMITGLLNRYGGDVHKALSAYNAGDPNARGTVTQWPDGARLGYADSVLRHYAMLSGGSPQTSPSTPSVPTHDALLDEMSAESAAEQSGVNALSSFALQLPAMQQQPSYSYRQLAGLDDNGNGNHASALGSIVDPDSDPDDGADLVL